jgi:hypothetical protein
VAFASRLAAGIDAQHKRVDQCPCLVVFSILSLRVVFYGDLAGLPPEAVLQEEETHLRCVVSLSIVIC